MSFYRRKLFLAVYSLVLLEAVVSTDKHLICKEVADVFTSTTPPSSNIQIQGHPGKRGAKGDVGPLGNPGPKGDPGQTNLTRISEIVVDAVDKLRMEMRGEMDAVEEFVTKVKTGLCHVEYEGKCFWVSFYKMNYNQAETECAKFSGHVSNIYSEEHLNAIMTYIRRVMPAGSTYIESWLGMTIDINTLQVSLIDGRPAPYLKWYPTYPRTGNSRHTQIILQVRPDVSTTSQNMWNYDPKIIRDGVLCEF